MRIVLRISRFSPGEDTAPVDRDYGVDVEPTNRILDALLSVQSAQDGSLSFRKSCGHGVCGSDAMRINDKERLACKTLVRDVVTPPAEAVIHVAPLRHLPIQRDLIVDQTGFFQRARTVAPYLLPATDTAPADGRERLQSAQQHQQFEEATKCINCAACFSACPVLDKNPRFLGPAAIVQAARFVEDSRDWGLAPRLDALDTPDGIWGCENHFECTRVCPREIKVTKLINLMKRRVTQERTRRGETVHDAAEKGA